MTAAAWHGPITTSDSIGSEALVRTEARYLSPWRCRMTLSADCLGASAKVS